MNLWVCLTVLLSLSFGLMSKAQVIVLEDFQNCGNGQVFAGELRCDFTWFAGTSGNVEVRFTGIGNFQLSQTGTSTVTTTISTRGFQNVEMTVNIVPPGTNEVLDFCVGQVTIGPSQFRQTQPVDGTEDVVQGLYPVNINPGELDDRDDLVVTLVAGKNSNSPLFECLFDNVRFTGTPIPTSTPTDQPTFLPTSLTPTEAPTSPTEEPTSSPTKAPTTLEPTQEPTAAPVIASGTGRLTYRWMFYGIMYAALLLRF